MSDPLQAPPGVSWWTIYLPFRGPVGAILAHTAHEAWRRARAPLPFCAYRYRPGPPLVGRGRTKEQSMSAAAGYEPDEPEQG